MTKMPLLTYMDIDPLALSEVVAFGVEPYEHLKRMENEYEALATIKWCTMLERTQQLYYSLKVIVLLVTSISYLELKQLFRQTTDPRSVFDKITKLKEIDIRY
ncbi:hypothetical protein Lser_V15G18407 [Lactuca serriola]